MSEVITFNSFKMDSAPVENWEKIPMPAEVLVRKQSGSVWYRLGKFSSVADLGAEMKKGLLVGPEQCDRVGWMK